MPKKVQKQDTLEPLITEIQELLNVIKNEQTNMKKEMERHHKVTMKKLDKLREFDEIMDMTNVVFEKRFSNIEQALMKMLSK